MDISKLDTKIAEEGAKMTVRHPKTNKPMVEVKDGVEVPLTITLVGMDSSRYRKAQNEIIEHRRNTMKNKDITADMLHAEQVQLTAACTVSFDNIEIEGELPSDAAGFRRAYIKFPWLFEQAQVFLSERANFLPD